MNSKVVYILEDDPDISELIAYILSDAGYQVEQFASVGRFNEVTMHNLPDIFILDILLPDGNGLDVCARLRTDQLTCDIPVLMMSANKTKRDIEAAGCGADFISKPFNIDHLLAQVEQYS
jgi:two-component system phosphate regulon response regulator PhoB